MRHHQPSHASTQRPSPAALFVDYENLHQCLTRHLHGSRYADEVITELLEGVRRHALDAHHAQAAVTRVYADFSAFEGNGPLIQRALCLQGAEPLFVPCLLQPNAAELQLCVDAVELLHQRPDVDLVVLVTGDRPYLPLLQHARRHGRRVLAVALEPPASAEPHGYRDLFVEATRFLGEATRRDLAVAAAGAAAQNGSSHNGSAAPAPAFAELDDPVLLRTLEIVEEHFGQYEEVYLTPLLRKLSELLDERQNDPKRLISELEKAGAARLEKRRGFPYDYTVLIVDRDHPDVQRIQHAFAERDPEAEDGSFYDRFDDDTYDEDDDYDVYADDDFQEDGVPRDTENATLESDDYDESEWEKPR